MLALRTNRAIARWTARKNGSRVVLVRSAAAFGRDPCDVPVRVFDIARLAVNAVLRVDHELQIGPLTHPLVDSRRAIALRRTAIDIVLGCLLELHVGDTKMH